MMARFVRLYHATDPRWLVLYADPLPVVLKSDDVWAGKYGRPLAIEPPAVSATYRLAASGEWELDTDPEAA